jgi:hypothetical protein
VIVMAQSRQKAFVCATVVFGTVGAVRGPEVTSIRRTMRLDAPLKVGFSDSAD